MNKKEKTDTEKLIEVVEIIDSKLGHKATYKILKLLVDRYDFLSLKI